MRGSEDGGGGGGQRIIQFFLNLHSTAIQNMSKLPQKPNITSLSLEKILTPHVIIYELKEIEAHFLSFKQ